MSSPCSNKTMIITKINFGRSKCNELLLSIINKFNFNKSYTSAIFIYKFNLKHITNLPKHYSYFGPRNKNNLNNFSKGQLISTLSLPHSSSNPVSSMTLPPLTPSRLTDLPSRTRPPLLSISFVARNFLNRLNVILVKSRSTWHHETERVLISTLLVFFFVRSKSVVDAISAFLLYLQIPRPKTCLEYNIQVT